MDFLDASALVKAYVQESGSEHVVALFAANGPISCARLGVVEVGSALARRRRQGDLDLQTYRRLVERLRGDARHLNIVDLSVRVAETAMRALERHPLRASDAIQLASALLLREEIRGDVRFWCFDGRLGEAAAAEGFDVAR